jgi:nitroreductase
MLATDLVSQLEWRYATKRFDPTKKIPQEIWSTLECALVLSPSSYGLQPWKFVVASDPSLRTRLRAAAWNQPQVEEASHFVVFAARRQMTAADIDRHVDRIVAVRGVPRASLDPLREKLMTNVVARSTSGEWAARQTYLALGTLLTSAALLQIDACPMEGLAPDQFDEILGLTDHRTLAACALGYRHPEDKNAKLAKVRFAPEDVFIRR